MLAVELPVGASFASIVKDCLFNPRVCTTRWEMSPWFLLENRKPMVATSNGWLAPGSFKAPSQPLSVTLMSSLPSEAWVSVVPCCCGTSEPLPPLPAQQEDCASQTPDSTNLKATTPCELPGLMKSILACVKWLQKKEESCPLCCRGKLTEMPHGQTQ